MRQRYIQSFNTAENVQVAIDNKELGKPYVAYIQDGQYIDWNTKDIGQAYMPLTFNIISAGTIVWKASNADIAYTRTIEYSTDGGETWTSITSTTGGTNISVNAGDKVQFRGDNATYCVDYDKYNSFSGSTAIFEVEGNIMSLIDSENFAAATTLETRYTFRSLYNNCTSLTSAENLILPATTLTDGCYTDMFSGCTSLTTAPVLPATTLANTCYYGMFRGCTSLTAAPELPATTLAGSCYGNMFQGCTSLTTAPVLPAETLESVCYSFMFSGCTSLNYIKCLATDISQFGTTMDWVNGVPSGGTFVKSPDMADWTTGADGIPGGWTVIDAE